MREVCRDDAKRPENDCGIGKIKQVDGVVDVIQLL
jgi:hypothetical protein